MYAQDYDRLVADDINPSRDVWITFIGRYARLVKATTSINVHTCNPIADPAGLAARVRKRVEEIRGIPFRDPSPIPHRSPSVL
jgi:hypothetical protein